MEIKVCNLKVRLKSKKKSMTLLILKKWKGLTGSIQKKKIPELITDSIIAITLNRKGEIVGIAPDKDKIIKEMPAGREINITNATSKECTACTTTK